MASAAECVAMGLQSVVDSLSHTADWVILKVDLSNAFNSVQRWAVLKAATAYVPAAYNYLKYAYSQEAPLYVGDVTIPSQKGTHQGCPLGPLGFSLAIQPVIEELTKPGTLLWSTWYLDDGVLVGTAAQVLAALRTLKDSFAAIGLEINLKKCELWGPAARALHANITDMTLVPWDPKHGITLLGSPINFPGSTASQDAAWRKASEALEKTTALLGKMSDAQLAHHLLRQCADACKVNHLLRATDCYTGEEYIKPIHDLILDTFSDILAFPLPPAAKEQAGLPLKSGGCGIKCPLQVRPAARISALCMFYSGGADAVGVPKHACQPRAQWLQAPLNDLQNILGPNFDPLPRWAGRLDLVTSSDPTHQRQNWWRRLSVGEYSSTCWTPPPHEIKHVS